MGKELANEKGELNIHLEISHIIRIINEKGILQCSKYIHGINGWAIS